MRDSRQFKPNLPERIHRMRGKFRKIRRRDAVKNELQDLRILYHRLNKMNEAIQAMFFYWIPQSEISELLNTINSEKYECLDALTSYKSIGCDDRLTEDFVHYASGILRTKSLLDKLSLFQEQEGALSNALTGAIIK